MRVSVIVPLYNKAPFIKRCLDSIAAQSFRDFEAIVVDDGSTDGGGAIAAAYPDARFRTIRQANAGPGAARNCGIAEARGESIAALDADDAWLPEYLDSSVRLLDARGPAVASVTSVYVEYPRGRSWAPIWKARGVREGVQKVTPQTPPVILLHMLACMTPCTTVARASVVRRWGGFREDGCRYAEDAMLWLKVLLNETVSFQLEPLVHVHRDASGLSGNLSGPHPLEPFLADPEEVERLCPPELRPLLRQFYAIRASKTAAVWGYWGEWREARQIFQRFVSARDWRLPFFAAGLAGSTPVARLIGRACRLAKAVGSRE
jgi:hypothetical protein